MDAMNLLIELAKKHFQYDEGSMVYNIIKGAEEELAEAKAKTGQQQSVSLSENELQASALERQENAKVLEKYSLVNGCYWVDKDGNKEGVLEIYPQDWEDGDVLVIYRKTE